MIKCTSPYVDTSGQAFGCGRCLLCRELKRRTWVHRLMLERLCHEEASFVTLTYNEESLPVEGSLSPQHLQAWFKRLRRRIEPRRIRYYAVGEYGSHSWRPHYHIALFGFGFCRANAVVLRGECQCLNCSVVRETWGFGHVLLGTLEQSSANYVCGYVIKNMRDPSDLRLMGRHPEFARMSLKPGIGADAMWDVASVMMQYKLEERLLPCSLRQGMSQLPIGRYLRMKLSKYQGQSEDKYHEIVAIASRTFQEEVRRMWTASILREESVRDTISAVNAPLAAQLQGRVLLSRRAI